MNDDFSPKGFTIKVNQVRAFLQRDLKRIVRAEGVKHFRQSFPDEGFTDDVLEPWPDISEKRKAQKRKRNGSLKGILTDTDELGNSIVGNVEGSDVTFSSDKDYAQIHNEGGKLKNGATMPKRQFIGPSKALDRKIEAKLDKGFGKILGTLFK